MKLRFTLSLALFVTAVQAQQIPASSVGGAYRALPGIVVPAMPANLCTADNNYCVTQATINTGITKLPSSGYVQPWTIAFVGKSPPCYYGGDCFQFQTDGTVIFNGRLLPAPQGNAPVVGGAHVACTAYHNGNCNSESIYDVVMRPILDGDNVVSSYTVDAGAGAYNPSGI